MKYIRIAAIAILILAAGLYGAGVVKEKQEEDPTRPTITSDREVLEISVNYTEEDLLQGLSAYDEKDGDLTSQILIGEFSQFVQKGVCNLSYVVFDSSNQAANLNRQVRFTDYESPKITLSQPLVFIAGRSSTPISYIGAQDVLDGDISALVSQVESTISYNIPGDYTFSVEVTNSLGDVEELTLPVHVIEEESQALEIQLSDALIYLDVGESFRAEDYIEGLVDASGRSLSTNLVDISSDVNTRQEGCYEVHYQAEDENGNRGETWLVVVARE